MKELIEQAFLQVDFLGPLVQAGRYDLIGPQGGIILPSVWEQLIEPDWMITMTMWPIEKPPPVSSAQGGPAESSRPSGANTVKARSKHKKAKQPASVMDILAGKPPKKR